MATVLNDKYVKTYYTPCWCMTNTDMGYLVFNAELRINKWHMVKTLSN